MAIRDKDEPYWVKELHLNNERNLRFFFKQALLLDCNFFYNRYSTNSQVVFELQSAIILLSKKYGGENKVINILKEKYNTIFLPDVELDWIETKDTRLCYYAWMKISSTDYFCHPPKTLQLGNSQQSNNYIHTEKSSIIRWAEETNKFCLNEYEKFGLCLNPTSAKECKSLIRLYFDTIHQAKDNKIHAINLIKSEWATAKEFKHKILKDKNTECIDKMRWLYGYIVERMKITPSFPIPINKKEIPGFVIAFIDNLRLSQAEKIVLLDKAYNALHSKQFKEKEESLRGGNLWLGAEEYHKLIKISEKSKQDKKLSLKLIIDAEYRKLFD